MINYSILAQAQQMYADLGFHNVEVPWRVSKAICDLTRPSDCPPYDVNGTPKSLIASGEQGFMELMNKGILPKDLLFQTCTPCFRSDSHDLTHLKQFMKVELICTVSTLENIDESVKTMAKSAFEVMKKLAGHDEFRIVPVVVNDPLAVSKQHDIEVKHQDTWIEVGSYGARQASFGRWIFGTGVAEPRFSRFACS